MKPSNEKVALRQEIIGIRNAIRWHRDQKLDDRCWLDDYLVWGKVIELILVSRKLPSFDKMMVQCGLFFAFRGAEEADPFPPDAILDQKEWDKDLRGRNLKGLKETLNELISAIKTHLEVEEVAGRPRTADDDRRLYAVLPEKVPADFRLPKRVDFLGEGKAPGAGCPAFWRSHQNCNEPSCNIHEWGPCGVSS
ncbi:MAG: hypothetical protein AAB589_01475 [Patescibacteria group bacterium]